MTKQMITKLFASASVAALMLALMAGCGTLINTSPAATDTSAPSADTNTADNATNATNSTGENSSADNAASAPAAGDSSSQPEATATPDSTTPDAASGQTATNTASDTNSATASTSDSANLTATAPSTFPITVNSYGFTYTVTGYQITTASNGSTAIILNGTGFDTLAQDSNGQLLAPVWCSFDAAGSTYQATACTSNSGTLTFTFNSADMPEWINLSNNQTKVQLGSFNVTTAP